MKEGKKRVCIEERDDSFAKYPLSTHTGIYMRREGSIKKLLYILLTFLYTQKYYKRLFFSIKAAYKISST